MKLYSISDDYIDFLRKYHPRIYSNKENERIHTRKYLGVVLKIGEFNYYIPLSSPKRKHDFQFKDGKTVVRKDSLIVIRLVSEERLLGTLQIGTMIPVPASALSLYNINKETDKSYKGLVEEELKCIKQKEISIKRNAKVLYERKMRSDQNPLIQSCLDFSSIEQLCKQWELLNC